MSSVHTTEDKAARLRKKYDKFRILIVGRANAGKTTILQRVCNTTDDPVVYDAEEKEVDPSVLASSRDRGLHDIENVLVFKSNPGFRFHDSRGFESGGASELDKVKAFIDSRSKHDSLQDRLHAIWYCIPLSDSRPFTTAEYQFFSDGSTGDVPIIAIFTKFDALEDKAFGELTDEGKSENEAKEFASERAVTTFEQAYLKLLYGQPYPPKAHVYLSDMNMEGADCGDLIEQTAKSLNDRVLQQLFVSTQRNNMKVCIKYALKWYVCTPWCQEHLGAIYRAALLRVEQKANSNASELHQVASKEVRGEMMADMLQWFPQCYGVREDSFGLTFTITRDY
ncbi:hypothetical protein FRC17_010648 [Serendipita sp. 399]|nr:hypothetical protein FRC17_010648 [Serendipita sp. 399]